jgi:LPS export ABC transporter protein LptC
MSGDVLIEQPGIENSVQIATPELLVLNTPQTAATDKPVRITRGDARTDAVGMRANLQTQYVELLAEVTSVYKPAP